MNNSKTAAELANAPEAGMIAAAAMFLIYPSEPDAAHYFLMWLATIKQRTALILPAMAIYSNHTKQDQQIVTEVIKYALGPDNVRTVTDKMILAQSAELRSIVAQIVVIENTHQNDAVLFEMLKATRAYSKNRRGLAAANLLIFGDIAAPYPDEKHIAWLNLSKPKTHIETEDGGQYERIRELVRLAGANGAIEHYIQNYDNSDINFIKMPEFGGH